MRLDLLGQCLEQPPFLTLVAVRFDQDGSVLFVHSALPFHALKIFVPVNPRRGREDFFAARSAPFPHAEVFKVNAAVRQAKIRAIVLFGWIRRVVLVVRFVFVFDAVFVKPVCDQQLFVALDDISLKRSKVQSFKVGVIIVLLLEIPFGFVVDMP